MISGWTVITTPWHEVHTVNVVKVVTFSGRVFIYWDPGGCLHGAEVRAWRPATPEEVTLAQADTLEGL